MGGIDVPADRYWGAQTQRSLVHFAIGNDRMPKRVYRAYGYVKKAAALVNAAAGRLPQWKADAIVRAADEAIAGKLDDHFPLYVWAASTSSRFIDGIVQAAPPPIRSRVAASDTRLP